MSTTRSADSDLLSISNSSIISPDTSAISRAMSEISIDGGAESNIFMSLPGTPADNDAFVWKAPDPSPASAHVSDTPGPSTPRDPANVPATRPPPQSSAAKERTHIQAQKLPSLLGDPSCPVKGMYRLFDLITEQGSSGLVDKIVIAQQSLQAFINTLSPGAYSSITKVNFKKLDNCSLKPLGVYGSKEEIVRFLREIHAVDDNTAEKLLIPQNRFTASGPDPILRTGLYVVRSFVSTTEEQEQVYVLYWPEDTTWNDQAVFTVRRNRVMFMRYLTKLCDQIVCLLSSEHSQTIAWGDEVSEDVSANSDIDYSGRLYDFVVAKTNDQEENVVARPGFMMDSPLLVCQQPPVKIHQDLSPRLLYGENMQGFMTAEFKQAKTIVKKFSHRDQSAAQIRLLLSDNVVLCLSEKIDDKSLATLIKLGLRDQFPKEFATWERRRKEIVQRSRKTHGERKKEMHTMLERNLEDTKARLREAVIIEVLKAFPSVSREAVLPKSFISKSSKPMEEAMWGDANHSASSVEKTAYAHLTKLINLVDGISQQISSIQKTEFIERLQREITSEEDNELGILRSEFVHQVEDLTRERSRSSRSVHVENFEAKREHYYAPESCFIEGRHESLLNHEIEYHVHTLHFRAEQTHNLQIDPFFVPTPILNVRLSQNFCVSSDTTVKYAHLLEGDRILLCLVDSQGNIIIFLDKLNRIDAAIKNRAHAKFFHQDKIGQTCLFAFDESKRMLSVYASDRMQLHVFVFDEELKSLRGLGTAIDLRPFYNTGVSIVHACFVHGSEEILFVDSNAQAKIFSLITLQPRAASLQLLQTPRAIYTSPDGSCVLAVQEEGGVSTLTAYHWSTFASTNGISVRLPDFPVDLSTALLTSVVHRNNIHLIGLDLESRSCRSVVLDITRRATEFTFQERRLKSPIGHVHNCLIDCHADVWTRFPVVPAVKRHTITSSSARQQKALVFVTNGDKRPFSSYFSNLIRTFERATRKPTGDELKGISISASTFPSFAQQFLSGPDWPVSRFRAGEWLADLLCLIPIHIAITHENRFVPLKDGVVSAELEKSLLGAEVNKIVDSLSLGWYESIFQSYWASKPVKVVSCMGAQSVGKSFALNHLVDTSFGGSAMRTAEGVWMSVTPTDDALIVALDFEGVYSLDLSAQEDTLLVLFNTAISNLVLFRNNFALSRDVSGLFQPFQSSSSVLNPTVNPSLFRSTLVVIIKDVIDSDKAEVTREFSLKFQKIVQDEQDANFISRLHAGKLQIIPWPVIESKEFYKLFAALKRMLDQQSTSHHTAGEFLHTLKTLMAKLKANDWGAMSQTMAAHRANTLLAIFPKALETGLSDDFPDRKPLKNFDSDLIVEAEDTEATFLLAGSAAPVADRESCLGTLRESWGRIKSRRHVDDSEWTSDLAQYLAQLVDLRTAHVDKWLKSNVQRFQAGNASIEELWRTFHNAVIDLQAGFQICRSQCGTCNLFCIQSRLHVGSHNCLTSHECIHDCIFCQLDFLTAKPCGQTAGHSGDHVCRVDSHLCGEPCLFSGKHGCLEECVKVIAHKGEHVCSAPAHMCGQPCDLIGLRLSSGKSFTCSETCRSPINEEHTVHVCEHRHCPVSCQLCKRSCSGDHLHGLVPDQSHLCGQEHSCSALCSSPGICQIDTIPELIDATFHGRHEIDKTFQYTKYTQVGKRLRCVKVIKDGEVDHPGPHIHSNENKLLHFCESRCGTCGYLCTLPLGHSQREHETGHGIMSPERWAIDGPYGTSSELGGRKFSPIDGGASKLCNLVCTSMGRHVHIDYCRGDPCDNPETQHISEIMEPNPDPQKDWITHGLHWRRMGFKDPYPREEQANFAKCDVICPDPEHTVEVGGIGVQPSHCTLALFHAPIDAEKAPAGLGYVSNDGHHFSCKNPIVMHQES